MATLRLPEITQDLLKCRKFVKRPIERLKYQERPPEPYILRTKKENEKPTPWYDFNRVFHGGRQL